MADATHPDLAETAVDRGEARADREVARTVPARPTAMEAAGITDGLPRGSSIGRYLVLEQLGAGGMGIVYAAYDPELDRKIALKLVRYGEGRAADTEGRARMLREAQAIARLAHPNVVAAYDVGTSAIGEVFIAMELVEGCTLAAWLAIEERTTPEILDMFAQAGRGLAAAHHAGLVHRDFKPDNVLIGNDGRARVVDFGLVRAVGGDRDDGEDTLRDPVKKPSNPALEGALTQVGALVGTPLYMAPEQLIQGVVDARTDQYSFAVALHEALSGGLPFSGDTFQTIAEQILGGKVIERPWPRKVPARVRAAVKRAMSVERDERFASMDELIAVLTRPERNRRLTVVAVSAGVVVAGVATMAWLTRPQTPAACGQAADQLASVWGPSQRASLQRTFLASGSPFARIELDATARALDGYAKSWIATYEDSCKATHERHEQSLPMLDQRTACLRQKRTAFATLVDLLGRADRPLVERAHKSIAELPAVDDCDIAVLSAPTKPADPVTAAAVAHERDELAKALALRAAGKYREALAPLERVYAAARALGYRPLIAEASEQLAAQKSYVGDTPGATQAFIEAFGAAAASRADQNAMRVAIYIGNLASERQAFDEAMTWLDVATGFVERLGNRPADVARAHYARGFIYDAQGKNAAAAHEYELARDIRERIAPDSLDLGRALNGVSRSYDELGRYEEARVAAERSVAIQEKLLGANHPELAIPMTNAGNIAADQGDIDAAERYYKRALAILEPTPGTFLNAASAANAINNLGDIAFQRKHLDEALAYNRRALAIREKLPDSDPDVAMSLSNLGSVLVERGDVSEALASFQRSLAVAEASVGKDHPYVGDALAGIGECERLLNHLPEARTALERALQIRKQGARPNELAAVQLDLAKTVWDLGDHPRAVQLARAARDGFAASPATKNELHETEEWLKHVSP